ncbi:AtpZ/AtpI family protein [Phaeovulum sp. W22_SRMD_FR3]|uniref:AtpZ/AtpI family protein n=1 Tax=Phaeovulum sp. W22_SRMD_FR3 TaxID=3240274 RepID=UPI003F96715E
MSPKPDHPQDASAEKIGESARRKQAARDNPGPNPLTGLSTFGMIGWSVVAPTLGGAFLGHWLDRVLPQAFSWTIALLLGGVVLGAMIAWAWISKEGGGK